MKLNAFTYSLYYCFVVSTVHLHAGNQQSSKSEVLNVNNPKLDVNGGASLFLQGFKINNDVSGNVSTDEKVSGGNLDFAFHDVP